VKNQEVLQVKMVTKFLAVIFVFVLGAAFFVQPNAADAAAEYRVVPIIEWKCWSCNFVVYTFAPDDIDSNKDINTKVDHQQKNWLNFGTGNPIRKCNKGKDGNHLFEKQNERLFTPYILSERKEDFIVLKSGGGAIKATVSKFKCLACGFEGFYFKGDKLFNMGALDKSKVENMKTRARIHDCFKWGLDEPMKLHPITSSSAGNPTSIALAGQIAKLWYSDN
jgi:hypothetical protein